MADEIVKKIVVDVSDAVSSLEEMEEASESAGYGFRSLGEAKKYIDQLRASLIDLEEDSDEYAETVAEIDTVQRKLNAAMKVTGSSLKNAEGSYNALSKKMSELKKAFKETNDEAERQALAKQIVKINDQLKTMDASIGNYQRNVGNYEGAFTKGLAGITKSIEALGNPLAVAKNGVLALARAFKALIMNPVGAIIMAIVVAIKALKAGFSGSEEATNRLKKAFAAFEPTINAVKNVFTGFANLVGKLAENIIPALVNALQKAGTWMMKLLNKIGIVSDKRLEQWKKGIEAQKELIKQSQELADREIKLEKRKRDLQVQEAKTEYEVSELRAKAADKEKYTADERQKFLEQAIAKERALNKTKLAVAQEEYNILLARSKQTDNNKEMNERLAASQANLYNTKKEYFDKERKLVKELATVNNELAKSEEDRLKEEEKAAEEEAKIREKELAEIKKIQDRTTLSLMESSERDLKVLKDKYEEEKALFEKYGEDTVKLTEEYNRKVDEVKANKGESKIKDLESEATLQQYIADKTIQIEYEKTQRLLEIDRQRLEGEKVIYEELLQLDNISAEKKQEYAAKLEEINAAIVDNSNQAKIAQQEHIQDLVSTYTEMASAIADILNDVASYWQDSIKERVKAGKMSEEQGKKEFENTKKVQIAAAIITGLAGVATAIATAMSLGPIMGPIVGAINAAAVATSTALQVAKIKSTTLDSSGSSVSAEAGSAAAPTAAATEYTPRYTTNITGESETTNLANAINEGQQDTRVYVVESDINEVGKRVEVRESEATF